MKTTVEIPEKLFRQAKSRAAMEGISLREFLLRGLRLALRSPSADLDRPRITFPLIRTSHPSSRLTDDQVTAAQDTDEDLI